MIRAALAGWLIAVSPLLGQGIEGTVVNSLNGAPLSGVQVEIQAAGKSVGKALTDAHGAFRLEGLAAGSHTANFQQARISRTAARSR